MRRGTTPTIKINIKGVPMYAVLDWYVTISQECTEITKTGDDITIDNTVLSITLSQKETMRFRPGEVEIQIRAKTVDGVYIASEICTADIGRILFNEVLD